MAIVGQALSAPEEGWKRYEEGNANISYGTSPSKISGSFQSGGSEVSSVVSVVGKTWFKFNFTGKSIRIISRINVGYGMGRVFIDGKDMGVYDENGANVWAALMYENTSLEDKEHYIEIRFEESAPLHLDAIDISSEGILKPYNAPISVGDQLLAPEEGWKRYDDTHPAIKYVGGIWSKSLTNGSAFNQSISFSDAEGAKIQFKFTGEKIRIISIIHFSYSKDIRISIDGVEESYDSYDASATKYQTLLYEKIGLTDGDHLVEIYRGSGSLRISLDAIDIDSTGRLLHPEEIIDPKDISIGKRIRCHYQAATNQVGTFSGLGEETSDFIPPASSANPNGDFYFICTDIINGKKILLADRAIQHSISWDKINEQGMTNTGREITF